MYVHVYTRWSGFQMWEIKYDKEGITIEDSLPMVELSRKKIIDAMIS
jgi:hypothetical protein